MQEGENGEDEGGEERFFEKKICYLPHSQSYILKRVYKFYYTIVVYRRIIIVLIILVSRSSYIIYIITITNYNIRFNSCISAIFYCMEYSKP